MVPLMSSHNPFESALELGLYSLWILPVIGVYLYLQIFVNRYSVNLKSMQGQLMKRLAAEEDSRRTRRRLREMSQSIEDQVRDRAVAIQMANVRDMDPETRLNWAASQGMILNLPVPIENLEPGFILGEACFHSNGDLLLPRGSYITQSHVEKLQSYGVTQATVMFHPENPTAVRLLTAALAA